MSSPRLAAATEWLVAAAARGGGSALQPFVRIQQALDVAQPGDVIVVQPGQFSESLHTTRSGSPAAPIRLTAKRGTVVVTSGGRVFTANHQHIIVEGFVFDGQYGNDDTVALNTGASHFTLRDTEVRHSTHDLIDLANPSNVLIEDCLIHHALNAAGGRTDAHGIVAGAVHDLTVRRTEIHSFSGDGIQLDPARRLPGWDRVTIEGVRIWLQPLPQAENGFKAGTVPGENGVDTKANPSLPRATMVIRDSSFWGFRSGIITNIAAFNLKENVDLTVDGVTVHDSNIAFRIRGATAETPIGAHVAIRNAVLYNLAVAFRYEDDIRGVRVWGSTVGLDVQRIFHAASAHRDAIEVRNLLVLGPLPPEARDPSNLSATPRWFVNIDAGDYRLAPGTPAIDRGISLPGLDRDRAGVGRPQGKSVDVGAYEWQADETPRRGGRF